MARYCVLSLLYVTICFTTFTCQELNENESIDVSRIKREGVPENRAFNTNAIVYDNSPWRPGREIDVEQRSAEDERKIKNLATRIMSNGVEVLVKDKSAEGKQEQRKRKFMHLSPLKPTNNGISSTPPFKSLLSSAVATVVNRQELSAFFPLHHLMQHNYIIKTCMTTYTYLTTVVQNKRSAVSTFETIVSVVTTESLTNLYATDVLADIKPTKTKYMEVKTIKPSASNMYINNIPKLDKRIDNEEHNFDLIQPSEISQAPCTTSCTCSHTKTETLKTKYSNVKQSLSPTTEKYHTKNTKYSGTKLDVRPTHKEILNNTQYRPYEYETGTQAVLSDKIVEKYTQVTDYLDDKDTNLVEASDLLTNEQAPPLKTNKVLANKTSENVKPERPTKVNKNKFVMAELIKLGSLGIKGLSQLAPVIEKMTGGFMKRQEPNKTTTTTTTTTVKPLAKITSYNANKRIDDDVESKHGNFPIYIPVDDMETSETNVFTNATLQQNFAWAAEHMNLKSHFVRPKIVHESPLVNGGIPISPGEIITANSDVIVGKPAVGGPLTLAASGIKLHNPVHPPPIDNFVANNEQYVTKEKPPIRQNVIVTNVDDSFDLRPPELPKLKSKPNKNSLRPQEIYYSPSDSRIPSSRLPTLSHTHNDPNKFTNLKKNNGLVLNHGRPAFLDFIPSFVKPADTSPKEHHNNYEPNLEDKENDIPDNNPSSSEIVNTKIITDEKYQIVESPGDNVNQPFLVDIQPSKVANVLIPHGSSTALVFAGSSEPHKTGDYIDDPLPYPEPGYFGSFSIDAPHMTNVHNVVPNNNVFIVKPNNNNNQPTVDKYKSNMPSYQDVVMKNEHKFKLSDNKRPKDLNKLPPPTSNQESHIQVGPKITAYNPEQYNAGFGNNRQPVGNNKHKEEKEVIDKEYENYLAVPPPPPKRHFNHENRYDKNKPFHHHSSLPITQTKPVQDSKVYLNVQHPVSNQLPPKVTSEIYFASQLPNSQPTPTYTFKLPQSPVVHANTYSSLPKVNNQQHVKGTSNFISNSYTSSNTVDTSLINSNLKENTYTVTLNTATNVAGDGKTGHVLGSSITVPITTTSDNGQINANIPIGTNFAIRVEDDPAKYESVALHGKRHPSLNYNEHIHIPFNNFDSLTVESSHKSTINSSQSTGNNKSNSKDRYTNNAVYPTITSSINSHANFPVMNEDFNSQNSNPVFNNEGDKHKVPLQQNISTNSHGWYSSILNEENIKNIVVESTTRKHIPLNYDGINDSLPEFGEKIATVGKPPAEFWNKNNKQPINNFGIGKPFSKPKDDQTSNVSAFTIKPNYIPSMYGVRQPTYDIPVRDNSEETTTSKILSKKTTKPVYETAEEIYDGQDDLETIGESDGEVSSESMSVPYVSTSKESKNITKDFSAVTVSYNITSPKIDHNNKNNKIIGFNSGTQTEKPFTPSNKTRFQSNSIKPVYENINIYMKPRPFTVHTAIPLDHQLQQPHWQINQLMENVTNNMSYEDNLELNTGEEINVASTGKPLYTSYTERPAKINKNKSPTKQRDSILLNRTKSVNESNIITSTVHIMDKKPLTVEIDDKSTPSFTILPQTDFNITSSEIVDLSPPPPNMDQKYKPPKSDEIMGMSPPPPRTSAPRYPPRVTQTPRPVLPIRTPPPYRTLPPRTLPPRQSTSRPIRKPTNRDEVSTYRPIYEITNKIKKPNFNFDQPSSVLLPPPRELSSQVISSEYVPKPTLVFNSTTNVIFPTPLSSSWLTSSNIGFSSSFNFAPTSVYFPESVSQYQDKPDLVFLQNSAENGDNSYEYESSSENIDISYENPVTEKKTPILKPTIKTSTKKPPTNVTKISATNVLQFNNDSVLSADSSQEDSSNENVKVITLGNKNRTRKPYPIRNDDKKSSTSKFKLLSKVIPHIKPSRIISRPEVSYPPRLSTIKKIVRPLPSRPLEIFPSSIIESSESIIEEDFIRPTEVLKDMEIPTLVPEITSIIEKTITSTLTISKDLNSIRNPTHHAGNEVKISDDIIPTKTEFKTTVITLTKTLSEPPQTVSSIGYFNLTQTLTVTHTETSLMTHSEGAVTETLILTNTHTSTIVDVVTEIYTQVHPTTIVETVTKHIPIPQVEPTPVVTSATNTKIALDDVTMSSEESDNFIIRDNDVTENIQKIDEEKDNDTFFVVMNKSQNGGKAPPVSTDIETGDYDVTRNEQVNNNGVSQVLFGEILLAGTPYLETINVGRPTVTGYGKECQPDCKASRNERCQRIDGIMKCVCRPGFARMFPDRPCKPTYTYSARLALGSQGNERLTFQKNLLDNSSKEYHTLAVATHEGINRMIMQSDLRDVYHGVHITGFHPVDMRTPKGEIYEGVINDFYVQLSDNAHESRLKEVIEKYLRNNNYSLGGTEVHAADQLMDRLNVSDFDECISTQFHDCSEHARCFNLRGTYTCSCLEGFADLSVNTLYPGRICSSDAVGCAGCNYHGTCFERESTMICECFKWYAGRTCQVNLKAVLITVTAIGAVVILVVTIWATKRCCCQRGPATQTFMIGCMQGMPNLHQGNLPSKQRADRRALIAERAEAIETCSAQNTSLPYIPSKQSRSRSTCSKKCVMSDPPSHAPPPPPAPALMIPRARLHPAHSDSRDNLARKKSAEICSEAKLISYLESGASNVTEEMRRKHSVESSYSVNKERPNKQGALVSAGFKVSTTVRPDENSIKEDRDDASSVNKTDLEAEMSRFDTLRKYNSQEDMSEWTDAERRIGELTLSEARSVGGTLPASTGRAASSTRLTHQTSDVSEFDSL
ncbi:uncharacterized protein LOC112058337 isoform X2 [Bicyclus anynana]|uniref:Uncharacterized protein LOC112058337 isoform X2 n=1 Tax=Bicyclus anynana TaxID=110368 RepID=A0ABM3M1G7_BICAN|nr:uncharacterized protein LOC112058337 isoform X2 [Bicyclus anynana]